MTRNKLVYHNYGEYGENECVVAGAVVLVLVVYVWCVTQPIIA